MRRPLDEAGHINTAERRVTLTSDNSTDYYERSNRGRQSKPGTDYPGCSGVRHQSSSTNGAARFRPRRGGSTKTWNDSGDDRSDGPPMPLLRQVTR